MTARKRHLLILLMALIPSSMPAQISNQTPQQTASVQAIARPRNPLPPEEAEIRNALAVSILTPDSALTEPQRHWLEILRS